MIQHLLASDDVSFQILSFLTAQQLAQRADGHKVGELEARCTAQQQRLHEMHAENTQLQGVVLSLSEGIVIRRSEPEGPWSPVGTGPAAGSNGVTPPM